MDITGLWTLQCMMFLMVAAGAILKKIGILKAEGKGMLTDLVLYFFLPCNIIHSVRMECAGSCATAPWFQTLDSWDSRLRRESSELRA